MAYATPAYFSIQQFGGIQQQADGTFLPVGSARDARNCCTYDGDLKVAAGYTDYDTLNNTTLGNIPTEGVPLKLIPVKGKTHKFISVCTDGIFTTSGTGGAWAKMLSFSPALATDEQIDYVQMQIGTTEYVVVATGATRMYKVAVESLGTAPAAFGTGATSYSGVVSAYDSDTLVVTLTPSLDDEAQRHALIDGIVVAGNNYLACEAASATGVILKETPDTPPVASQTCTIRGGGSDASTNFITRYGGRLFAAGDPLAPSRLYWSQVPGDGRSVEDWLAADASPDASGGYVEIGDERGDCIVGLCSLANQIVIFKKYSTWRLYGDRPSTYSVECVEKDSETMSNASVVIRYGQPYWLTRSGLWAYSYDAGVGPADNGIRYLREFFGQAGYSSARSKGCHCDNRMYFTCTESGSLVDDAVIEYDLGTGSIMVRDGFHVYDLCVLDGRMYMLVDKGDPVEYKLVQFNVGESYDGDPIHAYWYGQPTDMGMKFVKKQVREIHARCGRGNMQVLVKADELGWMKPRLTWETPESGYIAVPVRIDNARVISIGFENIAGSQFWIKGGINVEFERVQKP